jgi:hypothetical protein
VQLLSLHRINQEHLISDNAGKDEDKDNDEDDDNDDDDGDDDDDDDDNGARFLIPMTPAVFLAGTVLRLIG